MSTLSYKCPSCGSSLQYDGVKNDMGCNNCGNHFPVDTIKQLEDINTAEQTKMGEDNFNMSEARYSEEDQGHIKYYSCQSCGAQLLTDETTAATNCAFCGSPSIIPEAFTDGLRPERLVPFTITKKQAEDMFIGYFKGKKLLPKIFMTNNRINEIRQLYVPYWMFDSKIRADMTFSATKVSSYRSGNYRIETTKYYKVRRAGTLKFDNMPIDASTLIENNISESLEPYAMEKSLEYQHEQLSGALANRADVSKEECIKRAGERMRTSTTAALRGTVNGYTTVVTQNTNVQIEDANAKAVLLPIWVINTKKDGISYTFAINGQTGELTCNIPYSKSKFISWLLGLTAALTVSGSAAIFVLKLLGVI